MLVDRSGRGYNATTRAKQVYPIVGTNGIPQPPMEIVRRMQQIDDRLSLKWCEFGPSGELAPQWAITMEWLHSDPRKELIQRGAMPIGSSHDIVYWLPLDCSVDTAHNYIERAFVRWSGSKADTEKLLSRLHKYNEEQEQRNLQPEYDLADELVEANAGTLFREFGKTCATVYMTKRGPR